MYGPVRTVVWEDGGREAPSYPIHTVLADRIIFTTKPKVHYLATWSLQSSGSSIRNTSTAPVPERPQLLVKSTRVKSWLTLAWGSAQ